MKWARLVNHGAVKAEDLRPDVDWETIYESLKQVFEGN
nr:MAG TPA: hypothetical protein [Caudoviricetes sp.]